MAPANPYAPDLPISTIFAEKGWLQGAIVGGVAYGTDLVLFAICFYTLIRQTLSSRSRTKASIILLVYTTLIFILATLFMGSLAKFTEMAFVDNRNYPGGPNNYEVEMFSVAESEIGNISFVISNWLSDAMIVWRCAVIYRGCTVPLWIVMIFPSIIYGASFAMGLLWLLQISNSSPFGGTINWTLPYLSISLGLNVLITLAIICRLFLFRKRISNALGGNYGSQYTSLAAILVESAALYSMFCLFFLIPFGLNHYISTVFLQSLCQVQTAASLLIVYRITNGQGWTGDTATKVITSRSTSFPLSSTGGYRRNTSRGTFIQDKPATLVSTQVEISKEVEWDNGSDESPVARTGQTTSANRF